VRGAENSEVLPAELVAVAVMFFLLPTFFAGLKVKEAMPQPSGRRSRTFLQPTAPLEENAWISGDRRFGTDHFLLKGSLSLEIIATTVRGR